MQTEGVLAEADLLAVLARLVPSQKVAVHYITGHWLDVDSQADLAEARNFS
jgi:phosphoenolpyruvate phosphomutase